MAISDSFITMTLNSRDIRLYHNDLFKPARKQLDYIRKFINGQAAGTVLKEKIGKLVSLAVARNFKQKRDVDKTPWLPLKDTTRNSRKSQGYAPGPPLIRSGKLHASATGSQVVTFNRNGIKIRPRVGYSSKNKLKYNVHNRPSTEFIDAGNSMVPGRQFYYLNKQDFDAISAVMMTDLTKSLNGIARGKSAEGIGLNFRIIKLTKTFGKFL